MDLECRISFTFLWFLTLQYIHYIHYRCTFNTNKHTCFSQGQTWKAEWEVSWCLSSFLVIVWIRAGFVFYRRKAHRIRMTQKWINNGMNYSFSRINVKLNIEMFQQKWLKQFDTLWNWDVLCIINLWSYCAFTEPQEDHTVFLTPDTRLTA